MNKDIVLKMLLDYGKPMCDDCLSSNTGILPRQHINRICRDLKGSNHIKRYKDSCSDCKKDNKFVNNLSDIQEIKLDKKTIGVNESERLDPKNFEIWVKNYLEAEFIQPFSETKLEVGFNKGHKFDLVSEDKSIIVECKSYSWTIEGNYPSAKVSTAIETLFYLSRVLANKKVIIFQDHYNSKGESFVDVFLRRNEGMLDDIEIWVADTISGNIQIVRNGKNNWYTNLYQKMGL